MSNSVEERRRRVLEAALGCFARYGYRRASMETLAQAAGISRPALYLLFANKEEVFRAVAALMLDTVLAQAERAALEDGSCADRLYGTLVTKLDLVIGAAAVDHRGELIAEAESIAGDLLVSYRERFVALLERLLTTVTTELAPDGAPLAPHDAAELLFDAVTGIERETAPLETLRTRLRHLVELTVRGLRCS